MIGFAPTARDCVRALLASAVDRHQPIKLERYEAGLGGLVRREEVSLRNFGVGWGSR
jgi:hypothetical protein